MELDKTSMDSTHLITVASSFTVEPIADSLHMIFHHMDEAITLQFAPYGQFFQWLLDPPKGNVPSCCQTNILLLRVDDFLPSTNIEQLGQDLLDALNVYQTQQNTPLLLVLTESENTRTLASKKQLYNTLKEQLLTSTLIKVIDFESWREFYPVAKVLNEAGNRFGHVPYSEEYFAALSIFICRYQLTLKQREKKVIVLDCDNTLWRGICGEEGPKGVTVTEPFRQLQEWMLEQVQRGRLLCLASKNIEEDVHMVFNQNSKMVLNWDKIVAHRINWQPKSENIRAIAQELNLGLDSFLFFDDNPVEIAEVKAQCPEVLCVQIPKDEAAIFTVLQHVWAFDKHRVTEEDAVRTRTYQDNLKRNQLQQSVTSLETFLKKLSLKIRIEPLVEETLPRASQLSQRTNQFNMTTQRMEEAELRSLIQSPEILSFTVQVEDRFGDYGIVGLMLAQKRETHLMVTDFMLSCRALGKGVEHKMLDHMADMAPAKSEIIVRFSQTDRNAPAYQFLQSLLKLEGASVDPTGYRFQRSALLGLTFKPNAAPHLSQVTHETPAPSANKLETYQREQFQTEKALQWSRPKALVAALSEKKKKRPDLPQPYSKPKEGLEKQLADIWSRTLRMDTIGRNDRFVDLGGSSLLLVKIHTLILEELKSDIPITTLFKHATIATLAAHLQPTEKVDNRMAMVRQRALKNRAFNNQHQTQRLKKGD